MNPLPAPQPGQPYPSPPPYPYPPQVYVPLPVAPPDPLAFGPRDEPAERPRRRRREEPRGGNRGLIIALVVMVAVGLGWFGYVSLRAEWDKARLPEIRREMRQLWGRVDGMGQGDPASKPLFARLDELSAEYQAIKRRHPDWNVPPEPGP